MRIIALAISAVIFAGTLGPASAQAARRYRPASAPTYEAPGTDPRYANRGYQQYSQPPGRTGIIRWNTPNADGNLGTPSGGSGGGR